MPRAARASCATPSAVASSEVVPFTGKPTTSTASSDPHRLLSCPKAMHRTGSSPLVQAVLWRPRRLRPGMMWPAPPPLLPPLRRVLRPALVAPPPLLLPSLARKACSAFRCPFLSPGRLA